MNEIDFRVSIEALPLVVKALLQIGPEPCISLSNCQTCTGLIRVKFTPPKSNNEIGKQIL